MNIAAPKPAMPPSIWSIGEGAVAGALLFAVLGAILEAILGARFPIFLLPPVMAIGATVVGFYDSKTARSATIPAPDLGSARFASGSKIDALTKHAPESLAIGWTVNAKNTERALLYYSGPGGRPDRRIWRWDPEYDFDSVAVGFLDKPLVTVDEATDAVPQGCHLLVQTSSLFWR